MASTGTASTSPSAAASSAGDDAKAKKSRIIAFFRRYAPQDLYKVEMVLQSPLAEEQLFAELRTKYNVPNTAGSDLNSDVADIRQRLTAFYQRYAPNDLAKVDNALQMNLLEGQLFNALYTKYNVPLEEQTYSSVAPIPPSPAVSAQGSTTSSARKRSMSRTSSAGAAPPAAASQGTPQQREAFKQRLTALYKKVSPSDYMQKVQHAMTLNIPEQELLEKIYDKYSLGPDGEPKGALVSSPSSATLENPKQQQLRERLRAFYTIHNPNEVDKKVQNAMKLGLDETELFRILYNKYELNEDGSPRRTAGAAPAATGEAAVAATPPAGTLEQRLLAFYRIHNPAEATSKVEAAMRLQIPEKQLWANVYKAYNLDENGQPVVVSGGTDRSEGVPAPTSADDASVPSAASVVHVSASPPQTFRQRLEAFYKVYAPDSVDQKVQTAMSLNLSEDETFALLHQKYNVSAATAAAPPPAAANRGLQPIDAAQTVNSTDGAGVPAAEPPAAAAAAASMDPAHAFGSSPPRELNIELLRRRLRAFFTRYEADGDVDGRVRDSIDVVESGHMTEDELIRFIEQQYGPALELRIDDAALPPPAVANTVGAQAGAAPAPAVTLATPATAPSAPTIHPSGNAVTPQATTAVVPVPPPPTEASVRRDASEAALKNVPHSMNEDRSAFKERLREFYAAHGVDDVETKVEYAMRIDGSEDEIMARLSAKYSNKRNATNNVTASPKAAAVVDDEASRMKQKRQEKLRQRLTAFYERHNPSNMDKIDLALTLDIPEDILFSKLYEKYNLNAKGEPLEVGGALSRFDTSDIADRQVSSPAPSKHPNESQHGRRELEDRLFLLFAKVLPAREAESKARSVAQAATEPFGDVLQREEAALREQPMHGGASDKNLSPEPQQERGVSIGAATDVSTAQVGVVRSAGMKDRLTAFYAAHKASEVPRVDAILQSSFTDEMIWQRLRDRYGSDAVAPFLGGLPPRPATSPPPQTPTSQRSPNSMSTPPQGAPLPSSYTPPRRTSSNAVGGPSTRSTQFIDSALDRLVREAEEPMDAVPLAPAAAPTTESERQLRAVSVLIKLPDVNMFVLQRAARSARDDFVASFERDARSYVLVHGAVAGTPTSHIDPMRDDVVCMTYVALFQTAAGAKQFRTLIVSEGEYAVVPIPATRAAYLLLGGNPHAVREAKITGATLVEPPEALAVVRGAVPETSSTSWTPGRQTPESSYAIASFNARATHPVSTSPQTDHLGAADPEAPRGVTESLRMRNAATARLSTHATDAMLGNDAEVGSQVPTWGDIVEHNGSSSAAASSVPVQTREQFLVAKERELAAFSLELTERARLVQDREAAVTNAEQRALQAQNEEREAHRARRDASAEASTRFHSLTVREAELKERERCLAHKEEELEQREVIVTTRLTEASQRFALLEEREHRIALREKQLDDIAKEQQQHQLSSRTPRPRGPPPLYGSPMDYYSHHRDGGADGSDETASVKQYAMQLELRLKEAQQRVAALEGNPAAAASAVAAAAQFGSRDDTDLRLRHLVEREAQVSEAEVRLERTALESMQSVQHRDDATRRRWDDLRSQDRELLARRLEVEAIHDSVQRAARDANQTRTASNHQHPSSPSGGPRAAAMTPPRHTPIPSFSFSAATSNGLIRQDDISVMLERVKEREKMLRSMSERIAPTRALGH